MLRFCKGRSRRKGPMDFKSYTNFNVKIRSDRRVSSISIKIFVFCRTLLTCLCFFFYFVENLEGKGYKISFSKYEFVKISESTTPGSNHSFFTIKNWLKDVVKYIFKNSTNLRNCFYIKDVLLGYPLKYLKYSVLVRI